MRDGGHQPYKAGPREQGTPLQRMMMGEPLGMPNPMDAKRSLQRGAGAGGGQLMLSSVLANLAAKHAARR